MATLSAVRSASASATAVAEAAAALSRQAASLQEALSAAEVDAAHAESAAMEIAGNDSSVLGQELGRALAKLAMEEAANAVLESEIATLRADVVDLQKRVADAEAGEQEAWDALETAEADWGGGSGSAVPGAAGGRKRHRAGRRHRGNREQ